MALNAEPSKPEERESRHLAPKSYVNAAEEALEDGVQEKAKQLNGKQPETKKSTGNGQQKNGAVQPVRNGVTTPGEYTGSGILDQPSSRSPVRAHRRKASKNSLKSADSKEELKAEKNGLVLEEFHGARGDRLTSVKPSDDYASSRQDTLDKPKRRSELVSGRKAGLGWDTSGIRWAPLNVPLKRRLQMLMVLLHSLSITLFPAAFFFLLAIPLFWPLLVPYLLYIIFSTAPFSGTLSYRSETLRRLPIWSLFASYFPARLHRSCELPPTRKYLFGYHPHGIISHGAFSAFATEALGFGQLFPGITNTLLTLDNNFRLPLYRDYALRLGLAAVSKESCENILSKGGPNGEGMGRGITIVVGGAREALEAKPGSVRLILKRRKGFVKLAIRTGADLVPVFAFGENDLYDQIDSTEHPWIHKGQLLVKKFAGFTVPLFHARGVFNYDVGLMPYRRSLDIVVGKPIMVKQDKNPNPEYVDEIHAKYMQELLNIWEAHKDAFAKDRTTELEIVE
ncbi:DAGAT-domain-containing protein [Aulographum hederae CBS 113979]|uniref:diacylglycerol O-acyltransferase n=1 Tax=Aulographum hederae CBS 113979 TaxID=1176131 RepID=A0A6G1GUA2_9PEZI|nr:DAGAT-domain-containing protein [Aulographum hederae CBS 113979]